MIPARDITACRLLIDPPAAGTWNMAVDEVLLQRVAAEGGCVWRFYRWSQPTLSLGYSQRLADRAQHRPSLACPLVRRPSGGGAIVHDLELTYSLAVSSAFARSFGRRRLYDVVHAVLLDVLAEFGVEAFLFPGDVPGPTADERPATAGRSPERVFTRPPNGQAFLCFQRRAPGDVIVAGGHKIAGSAQRRLQGAVLQHGSVLLGCSRSAPELPGLRELARRDIITEKMIDAWQNRLESEMLLSLHRDRLADDELTAARRLAAEKYASSAWTER